MECAKEVFLAIQCQQKRIFFPSPFRLLSLCSSSIPLSPYLFLVCRVAQLLTQLDLPDLSVVPTEQNKGLVFLSDQNANIWPSRYITRVRWVGDKKWHLTNSKSPSINGRCILTGFSGWALAPAIGGWTTATGAGSWLGADMTVRAITPTVDPVWTERTNQMGNNIGIWFPLFSSL